MLLWAGPSQAATWEAFPENQSLIGAWRAAGRYPGAVCVAGGLLLPEPRPEAGRRVPRPTLATDPALTEAILWSVAGNENRWWVVERAESALVRVSVLFKVGEDPDGRLREGLYEGWIETEWREKQGWSWRMEHELIGPAHLRVRAWVEGAKVGPVLAAVDQLPARLDEADAVSRSQLRARGAQLLAIDAALGRAKPPHPAPTLGEARLQVLILGDLREIPVELWADPRWPDWRPDMAEVLEKAAGLGAQHCPG
jgi:hypothetical protein